jgi:hypothetical protein
MNGNRDLTLGFSSYGCNGFAGGNEICAKRFKLIEGLASIGCFKSFDRVSDDRDLVAARE